MYLDLNLVKKAFNNPVKFKEEVVTAEQLVLKKMKELNKVQKELLQAKEKYEKLKEVRYSLPNIIKYADTYVLCKYDTVRALFPPLLDGGITEVEVYQNVKDKKLFGMEVRRTWQSGGSINLGFHYKSKIFCMELAKYLVATQNLQLFDRLRYRFINLMNMEHLEQLLTFTDPEIRELGRILLENYG